MKTPKIAERVKFWQEQDRINRELIPRVIKSHELLTRHVENHPDFVSAMAQIQAVEAQVAELSAATKAQIESVEDRVDELAATTKAQIEGVEGRVDELAATTTERIQTLESRTVALEKLSADLVSRLVPYAALAVAIVASIVALVK